MSEIRQISNVGRSLKHARNRRNDAQGWPIRTYQMRVCPNPIFLHTRAAVQEFRPQTTVVYDTSLLRIGGRSCCIFLIAAHQCRPQTIVDARPKRSQVALCMSCVGSPPLDARSPCIPYAIGKPRVRTKEARGGTLERRFLGPAR